MLNQFKNIHSYDRLLTGNNLDALNEAITTDSSILTRKDAEGSTLLHALATKGFKSIRYSQNLTIDAINLLKKSPKGAVNIQDEKGLTPFHHQVLMALPSEEQNDQLSIKITYERAQVFPIFVNFALNNGYDFTLADTKYGYTVFHLLAREKPLEAAGLLKDILENPAFTNIVSLNAVSKKGKTALALAILEGSLTAAGILIDNGASPIVPENNALELLKDYKAFLLKRLNDNKYTKEKYDERIQKVTIIENKINVALSAIAELDDPIMDVRRLFLSV